MQELKYDNIIVSCFHSVFSCVFLFQTIPHPTAPRKLLKTNRNNVIAPLLSSLGTRIKSPPFQTLPNPGGAIQYVNISYLARSLTNLNLGQIEDYVEILEDFDFWDVIGFLFMDRHVVVIELWMFSQKCSTPRMRGGVVGFELLRSLISIVCLRCSVLNYQQYFIF